MKNTIINQRAIERRSSKQRGASLLEGIAYLGIAAIVILGAVSLLTGAFGSAQNNRATEEIVSLRTAAKKLYAGQVYPAAMNASMIAARAVPGSLAVDTATAGITHSWGGAVTLVGNNSAAANTFVITYAGVPQDACVNIVSGAVGWTQISIGGAGGTQIAAFPATADAARTGCSAATNDIAFTAI